MSEKKGQSSPLLNKSLSNIPAVDTIRLLMGQVISACEFSHHALVSHRIFSIPEFAPYLKFVLKTDPKEFTKRSPNGADIICSY